MEMNMVHACMYMNTIRILQCYIENLMMVSIETLLSHHFSILSM